MAPSAKVLNELHFLLGEQLDRAIRNLVKRRRQEEHKMGRVKGLAGILGIAVLMAVLMACGNGAEPTSPIDDAPKPDPPLAGGNTPTTPIISHGGPVEDYASLVENLRAAGATVDPAGTITGNVFAPQEQILTVNGESVVVYEFGGAEEADAAADGVSPSGSSIVTIMADGTQRGIVHDWRVPAHFYKAGNLIVLYVACDSDVISLLEGTIGPQFAGGWGLHQCPARVPSVITAIFQALEATEGLELTVSGFLFEDRDGNTRLCNILLESSPPQCGGDRIDLLGFDASSVPDSRTPRELGEIETVRWTESQITVTGITRVGGLTEVRLSTPGYVVPSPITDSPPTKVVVLQADLSGLEANEQITSMRTTIQILKRRLGSVDCGDADCHIKQLDDHRIMMSLPDSAWSDKLRFITRPGRLVLRERTCTDSLCAEFTDVEVEDGLGGDDVAVALANLDAAGGSAVVIQFNPRGSRLFGDLTNRIVGDRTKRIAIYLDDVELVALHVRSPITDGRTIITGDITTEEARMLATLLGSGVLEVPITMLEVR